MLLLDEPTNHLDLPAIEWLEKTLAGLRAAIVLISHDRRFLETLSKKTLWIDRGITRELPEGFAHFEAWRDKILDEEEAERHKLDRKIVSRRKLDAWRRDRPPQAQRPPCARIESHAPGIRDHRHVQGNVRLAATDAGTSSRLIVEALDINKSYGGTVIVREFSTTILRGDRIGVVGPNGAGKTTLPHAHGELTPDSGTIRLGQSLELMTLDQKRDELKPEWTLGEALTGGRGDQVSVNGKVRHVVSYMKDFLFTSEQVRSPLKVLSGGERGRLMLARALAKPSNVLVLDEPTNDLDLETLDLLQELLADYPGTVILVSHDRDFLDRVVTSVIAAEGDGQWREYPGGYSDMLAQRKGADLARRAAVEPKTAKAESAITAATEPPKQKRKLSFKEKHALETLPAAIDRHTPRSQSSNPNWLTAAFTPKTQSLQRHHSRPRQSSSHPLSRRRTVARTGDAQAGIGGVGNSRLRLKVSGPKAQGARRPGASAATRALLGTINRERQRGA